MPPFNINVGVNTSDRSYGNVHEHADAAQTPLSGAYGGVKLTLITSDDSLADAAEEISVMVAEDDGLEIDDEPEVSDDEGDSDEILDPEKVPEYLGKAGLENDQQRQLLQADLLSGRMHNVRERLARAFPDDPTNQYLALKEALHVGEAAQKSGTPDARRDTTLTQLRNIAADIQLESGDRIRANINTIDIAGGAGQSAADVKTFQTGYQDIVLGKGSLSSTLQTLLGPFGAGDPAAALTKLSQALGRDLASTRPSVDGVRINALLNDQFHAATAVSVLERCKRLPVETGTPSPEQAGELMTAAASCTAERWVGAEKFTALAQKNGGADSGIQINFATSFRAVLRDMPVQVYQDGDHRDHVLSVAQEGLDQLIEEEEDNE